MHPRLRFPEKEDFSADAALFSLRLDVYREDCSNGAYAGLTPVEVDRTRHEFFRPPYPASENLWRSGAWAWRHIWSERPVTISFGIFAVGIIGFLNIYYALKGAIS